MENTIVYKSITHFVDIILVFVVSAATYALESVLNAQGLIDTGIYQGVPAVLAGALTVVLVTLARGGSFAELGFRRPESWRRVPLQVLAILVAFVVIQTLVPLLLGLFMEIGPPDWSRYDFVPGNLGAAVFMALMLPLTASIPEEIIYRGFLLNRLLSLFGDDRFGAVLAVVVQSCIFGAIHFQWDLGGMVMTVIMGAVWGTAYLLCGRNLWVVILAHSGGHLMLVTLLYYS